jgi:uncharacterized protein with ParB-like and HNH nuclease domain
LKIKDLFEKNDDGKLILPNFQREYEWPKDKQKSLLSSFLTQLPVGSLLILEGKKEDFSAKKLCFPYPLKNGERKDDCLYLLDGQQRVSSLKSIFSDFFSDKESWVETWESMYSDLRNRWFIRAIPVGEDEEDIFGWRNLQFNDIKEFEPGEILDYIENKRIYKTKNQDWFNPGYVCNDENGKALKKNRLKIDIAKKAAEDGLVPLYSIYDRYNSNDLLLHELVIEQLKNNRIDQLKADVRDGKIDLEEILEPVDPFISEYIDDEEKIRDVWSRLGAKWAEQFKKFLNELLDQTIPIIQLPSNEIRRAISIFENINEGGTQLNTFDLVVAKAARAGTSDADSLSQKIKKELKKSIKIPNALVNRSMGVNINTWTPDSLKLVVDNKLINPVKDKFLNLLSVFCHVNYGDVEGIKVEHIKRNKILSLNHEQINSETSVTLKALTRAFAFLQFRLGITDFNKLSYELTILPIAYSLRDDKVWNSDSHLSKIEYWYWASVFGGAYRENQNQQSIKDLRNLYRWIKEGENKFKYLFEKVLDEPGYSNLEILLLKDDNHVLKTSVTNSMLQYVLSKQPRDFLTSDTGDIRLNTWDIANKKEILINGRKVDLNIEDHHIIPLAHATDLDQSTRELRAEKDHILNSPLNRTYISASSNQRIKEWAPERYFKYVNELSQWGHCIPRELLIPYSQSSYSYPNKEVYYEDLLTKRYYELKKEIKSELEQLQSI